MSRLTAPSRVPTCAYRPCNDMDTASLLIALFRASNIPARYVYGTIQLPINQIMNWVGGFTDPKSALEFMAQGGVPITGEVGGGKIVAAKIEHVWVQAYVSMIPSFGAINGQGDTWVPMDASFKQYTYKNGVNLQAVTNFDAKAFFDHITSTAVINQTAGSATSVDANYITTTITNYATQAYNYINQIMPNAGVEDIIGGRNIVQHNLPVLAETLPYQILATGWSGSQLPDNLIYNITFTIFDQSRLNTVFSVTKDLPEIAGKRVTLSYTPATSADESVLLSYVNVGATSLPAYLINLKPQLMIDGQVVATGSSIGMGNDQLFNITIDSPNLGSNPISKNIVVGTYNAIVFDPAITVSKQLNDIAARVQAVQTKIQANDFTGITKDDIIGEFVYSIGVGYWGTVDTTNHIVAQTNNVVDARLPSEGIFTYDLTPNYAFGSVISVVPSGFQTDINTDQHIVAAKNGDTTKSIGFMSQTGMMASQMEASVYDLAFNKAYTGRGISTAQILAYANQQGIPIYTINSSNINSILPILQVSNTVKTEIQDAAASGEIVTIPQSNITKDGWTGVGYLIYDPTTGAGAYMINGGLAGGGYNCACFGFDPTTEVLLGVVFAAIMISMPVVGAILSIALAAIGLYSDICKITGKNLTPDQTKMLIALAIGIFVFGVGVTIISALLPPVYLLLVMSLFWILYSVALEWVIDQFGNIASLPNTGFIERKICDV